MRATTRGSKRPGDTVNLESDVLGRMAMRRNPVPPPPESSLTMEMLAENGFL